MTNETNTLELSPKQALSLMKQCYEINEPVYLEGPRGVGKTELHAQLAQQVDAHLHEPLILTNMEPMDLRGLVQIKDGITTWARPAFLPDSNAPGRHILFIDEIPNADPRLQTPLYQIFHERRSGEHKLPPGTWVSGAGNIAADNAVLYEVQGPLLSRCTVIRLRVSHADWDEWAEQNDVALEVRTFLKVYPEFLDASTMVHKNPDDRITPNPRAWGQSVSKYIKTFGATSTPETKAFVAGKVGLATAEEFLTTLQEIMDVPSAKELLQLVEKATKENDPSILNDSIPTRMASLYGVVSSLTRHCRTLKELQGAMAVFNLLVIPKDGLPREDVRVMGTELLLKEVARQNLRPQFACTPEWNHYRATSDNLEISANFAA